MNPTQHGNQHTVKLNTLDWPLIYRKKTAHLASQLHNLTSEACSFCIFISVRIQPAVALRDERIGSTWMVGDSWMCVRLGAWPAAG